MKMGNKAKMTNVLLGLLVCLVTIDLAIRLMPSSSDSLTAIGSANSQESDAARAGPSTVPMYFPPFAIPEGRKRLTHVAIMVRDLEKSIDFYVNQLGFRHLRTQDMGFLKIAFISSGDGETMIELEQLMTDIEGMEAEGYSHIGMFVDDVDAVYAASTANGVEWERKPGRPGPGAPYMGFMIDPDGYRLEIMENPQAGCTGCHRGPHLN